MFGRGLMLSEQVFSSLGPHTCAKWAAATYYLLGAMRRAEPETPGNKTHSSKRDGS